MRKRRKIYRSCLLAALCLSCACLSGLWFFGAYGRVPRNIRLRMGQEQVFDVKLPVEGEIVKTAVAADSVHIDLSSPVTMKADTLSTYQMNLKLFGFIPFKQVEIEVIRDMELVPVGLPVGIYLETDGLLVIGVGDFLTPEGNRAAPAEYLLKAGDYILRVDGEPVKNKANFLKKIEGSKGEPVELTLRRGKEEFDVNIKPAKNQSGEYKLGVWVRDNAQGIGTMTFVDEEGNFGALGHGISDVDTGVVLSVQGGSIYNTEIIAIKKGKRGEPGEMTGMIEYKDKNRLGSIKKNTPQGIFGTCNEKILSEIETEPIPIALKQEVEIGPAQILCTVDGKPRFYDIEIKELHLDHSNINKGIVLKVTDEDLIAITGGIVQGMSGAPIIQNGRLVGAVTHVLVNDSTSGYGIFIEEMLGEFVE